jgi:hypothetical protein
VKRRRGRRRKKLLDDFKDRRGYCLLKEEAMDRTVWTLRNKDCCNRVCLTEFGTRVQTVRSHAFVSGYVVLGVGAMCMVSEIICCTSAVPLESPTQVQRHVFFTLPTSLITKLEPTLSGSLCLDRFPDRDVTVTAAKLCAHDRLYLLSFDTDSGG